MLTFSAQAHRQDVWSVDDILPFVGVDKRLMVEVWIDGTSLRLFFASPVTVTLTDFDTPRWRSQHRLQHDIPPFLIIRRVLKTEQQGTLSSSY